MGRLLPSKVLVAVVVLVISSAAARGDATSTKAKQLYDDGVTNYNLGHYDEALTSFEAGYRVRHDPAFLFNIAQCQRGLRRYEDAERSYRAYLRESPELPQATRDQVQKLIADMAHAAADQHPKEAPPPAAETKPSPPPASTTNTTVTNPAVVATAPTRERPVYKRPWFLPVVIGGAVVVAGGITLGVLLGSSTKDPRPTIGVANAMGF